MPRLAIDEAGRFGGYAAIFERLDDGGDIVAPGAFSQSLRRRNAAHVRMLFQHDPKEPIGLWTRLVEDRRGLWAEGQLTPGVPRSEALRALIACGAVDGLSIGFRTLRALRGAGGSRRLSEIDLWEISIVTFPMQDGARIAPADATRVALDAALAAFHHT